MYSPFPGMDPFLEDYIWPDFHTSLAVVLRNRINKLLPPELIVNIEATAITENLLIPFKSYRPDVSINESSSGEAGSSMLVEEPSSVTGVLTPPSISMARKVEVEISQKTLQVKKLKGGELVAAIEILSPANKRMPNLKSYREKRESYFDHGIHVLELDLLREGIRPVHDRDMPDGIYYIHLENAHDEILYVWSLGLSDSLPTLSLPLLKQMPPLVLNLQAAFDQTYDDAGYERALNYHLPLRPALRREVDRDFYTTVTLTPISK